MEQVQTGLFRDIQEWIDELIDPGSFVPFFPALNPQEPMIGDEIITGLARVHGRPVALYAVNTQVDQGFITSKGAIKIHRLMQKALELGVPLIAFLSSPGISIQQGVISGDEYSRVIMAHTELSGQIPQLAVLTSVVMGGSAYSSVLMDLTFFNRLRSHLMISGPAVVSAALGEKTTLKQLGGATMHATQTGLAHFVDGSIPEQLARVKWILDFLPSNDREEPPRAEPVEPRDPLPRIPREANAPFDMHALIRALVDRSEFQEYSKDFGPSLITAFARIDGRPVGIVANQSLHLGGAINAEAARKAARFVRLCDSYSVPILTLIDVPGYLPGQEEEQKGILRDGSDLCKSMYTRSPKLSVVVRRCYGAAAFVMLQGQPQNGDLVLALEGSRIAVMGFEAATMVLYKNGIPPEETEAYRQKYYQEYERPEIAYTTGMIDQIIALKDLRATLGRHLTWVGLKRDKKLPAARGIYP